MKRFFLALLAAATLVGIAQADTVIVNETFDSYVDGGGIPDQDAFQAAWRPDNGDGIVDFLDPTEAGFLVPNTGGFLNPPNDNPPGLQGVGVASAGIAVNESNAAFSLIPSATQWVRYGGDIFNDGPITNDSASGMRQTIGLRNDNYDRDPAFGCQCGTNFVELGFYNTSAVDPITGATRPNTQFQFRIALFSRVQPGNIALPNWLSFQLDPALDLPTGPPPDGDYNDDGTVNAADYVVWRDNENTANVLPNDPLGGTIGQAQYDQWRTNFGSATMGDGIVNINDIGAGWHRYSATIRPDSITVELDLYRDGINNATGQPGVDASETWAAQMDTSAGAAGAFKSLRIGPPSGISGNDHTVFDNVFLTLVDVPAAATSVGAVPEPATVALAIVGVAGLLSVRRRLRG